MSEWIQLQKVVRVGDRIQDSSGCNYEVVSLKNEDGKIVGRHDFEIYAGNGNIELDCRYWTFYSDLDCEKIKYDFYRIIPAEEIIRKDRDEWSERLPNG